MKEYLKRGLCLLISLMLMLGDAPAFAGDLSSAFNSLVGSGANPAVAINQPGYYSSETRGAFIAGGLDVRFPNRSIPSIINVVPFQFSAGCGGISLAFGGFSFINGAQIEQLIKSVAQDAIGMAVELVMTTLCGPCASVMQVMRQLAMEASNHSIDACQLASNFMSKYGRAAVTNSDLPQVFNSTASSICGLFSTINGYVSDDTEATSGSSCNTISEDVNHMSSWVSDLTGSTTNTTGTGSDPLCTLDTQCNELWHLMNKTPLGPESQRNDRYKLLLMNLIGTNLITLGSSSSGSGSSGSGSSSSSSTAPGNTNSASNGSTVTASDAMNTGFTLAPGPHSYLPTLGNVYGTSGQEDLDAVYKLLMCGTEVPAGMNATAQGVFDWQCAGTPVLQSSSGNSSATTTAMTQLQQTPVWVCVSNPKASAAVYVASAYAKCDYIAATALSNSPLAGEGFLPQVAELLAGGVQAIQQGNALSPQLIGLIEQVPVPIYQAINIAAVYPQAGADLMSLMSVEVSELLTYSYIQQIVHQAGLFQQDLHLPQSQLAQIFGLLDAIRAGTINDEHTMLTQMTLQQQMMQEIRILNIAMQRQVLPPQLLTENEYGTQLASSVTGNKP